MHPDLGSATPKKAKNALDFSRVGKKSTKIKPLFGFAFLVHLTSLPPVQVSCTIKSRILLGLTHPLDLSPKKDRKLRAKKWSKSHRMRNEPQNRGNAKNGSQKNPVKQPTPKMANHPKSAAPKMSQNGRKAIRTCNLPHSEAVKANDPNAWVPAHEIFLPQRFRYFEISKVHKLRI
jgi:hypothetical protein